MSFEKIAMGQDGYGMPQSEVTQLQESIVIMTTLKGFIEKFAAFAPPGPNPGLTNLEEAAKYATDYATYIVAQDLIKNFVYYALRTTSLYGRNHELFEKLLTQAIQDPNSLTSLRDNWATLYDYSKYYVGGVLHNITYNFKKLIGMYSEALVMLKTAYTNKLALKNLTPREGGKLTRYDIWSVSREFESLVKSIPRKNSFSTAWSLEFSVINLSEIAKENYERVNRAIESSMRDIEKANKSKIQDVVRKHVMSSPRAKGLDKGIEYLIGPANAKATAIDLLEAQIKELTTKAMARDGAAGFAKFKNQMIDQALSSGTPEQWQDLDNYINLICKQYADKFSNWDKHSSDIMEMLDIKHPKEDLHMEFGSIGRISPEGLKKADDSAVALVSKYRDGYGDDQIPIDAIEAIYKDLKPNLFSVRRQSIVANMIIHRLMKSDRDKSKGITIRNFAEKAPALIEMIPAKQSKTYISSLNLPEICKYLEERTRKDATEGAGRLDDNRTNFDYTNALINVAAGGGVISSMAAGHSDADDVSRKYFEIVFQDLNKFLTRYTSIDMTEASGPEPKAKEHSPEQASANTKRFADELVALYAHLDAEMAKEGSIKLNEEKSKLYALATEHWPHIAPATRLKAVDEIAQTYHNRSYGKPQQKKHDIANKMLISLAKNPNLEKLGESVLISEALNTYYRWSSALKNTHETQDWDHQNGDYKTVTGAELLQEMLDNKVIKQQHVDSSRRLEAVFKNNEKISLEQDKAQQLYTDIRNTKFLIEAINGNSGFSRYLRTAEEKVPEVVNLPNWEQPFFRLNVLEDKDPRHFTIGSETNCCQVLGDAGSNAAIDSFVNKYAGVLTLDIKVKGAWTTAFQSYFHYIPEDKSYILDNIESNANVASQVKMTTGLLPEEIYALWAAEMKERMPGIKYVGLGKEYTKINFKDFSPMKLPTDPRTFHHEVADSPYSDFDHEDAVNLLNSKIEIPISETEEVADPEDQDWDDEEEDGEPWMQPLIGLHNSVSKIKENLYEVKTFSAISEAHNSFRDILYFLLEQRGKAFPGMHNKSISYLEKKLWPKESMLNFMLKKLGRALSYKRKL